MSERAADLANQLESTASSAADLARSMTDAQWTAICPADGRQNNVVIDHIAATIEAVMPLAGEIIAGRDLPPITFEMVHEGNGAHAAARSGATRDEVLANLAENAASAAATIRTWSAADLAAAKPFPLSANGQITPDEIVQAIIVGHANQHLADIRAGLLA